MIGVLLFIEFAKNAYYAKGEIVHLHQTNVMPEF